MAKLNDAKRWLDYAIADPQRANSIISRGRDQSVFTKTKRGCSPPDLVAADYAKLCFCALMTDLPSRVGETVEHIGALQLTVVSTKLVSHRSWVDDYSVGKLPEKIHDVLEMFSMNMRQLASPQEATALWVLTRLFESYTPNNNFHRDDQIALNEEGGSRTLTMTLNESCDDQFGLHSAADWGRTEFRLTFENLNDFPRDNYLRSTRAITEFGLNDLADMTRQPEEIN